jgi:hypothetical protein
MQRKKVDERVRTLIENGVKTRTRSLYVIVGDRGKDQVANLHYILAKAQVKARPSVLWCYSKELGFSTCVCQPPSPKGVGCTWGSVQGTLLCSPLRPQCPHPLPHPNTHTLTAATSKSA